MWRLIPVFFLWATLAFSDERTEQEYRSLEKAEKLFEDGKFNESQKIAISLWENAALSDSEDQYRISVLLCRISFIYKKDSDISKWFERLYRQNKEFVFDVYVDPPELHEKWNKFRDAKNEENAKSFSGITTGIKKKSKSWIGFMPFGIGHFDFERYPQAVGFAALDIFSIYLMQSGSRKSARSDDSQTIADPNDDNVHTQGIKQTLAGVFLFTGSWGYQVADLAPDIYSRDRSTPIDSIRYGLSFVPFGVGQYKNRHFKKAWILGSVQLVGLSVGMFSDKQSLASSMGYLSFALSYGYSIYDAWFYHEDRYPNYATSAVRFSPWVTPHLLQDSSLGYAAGLSLNAAF